MTAPVTPFDRMLARLEAAGLILRVGDARVLTPIGNACAEGLARGTPEARALIEQARNTRTPA